MIVENWNANWSFDWKIRAVLNLDIVESEAEDHQNLDPFDWIYSWKKSKSHAVATLVNVKIYGT